MIKKLICKIFGHKRSHFITHEIRKDYQDYCGRCGKYIHRDYLTKWRWK